MTLLFFIEVLLTGSLCGVVVMMAVYERRIEKWRSMLMKEMSFSLKLLRENFEYKMVKKSYENMFGVKSEIQL